MNSGKFEFCSSWSGYPKVCFHVHFKRLRIKKKVEQALSSFPGTKNEIEFCIWSLKRREISGDAGNFLAAIRAFVLAFVS